MAPTWSTGALSRSDVAALHRVLRTVYLAELVFGDAERARYWLCAPKVRLQGRVPLMIAAHVQHAHQLEQWLMEIAEGRSEARRVGKGGVSTGRSRGSPYH